MVFRTLSRSSLGTFPASNGYKVDLSSSGLIDHLKYRPLLHCNMLIQPSSLFFLDVQFSQTPTDYEDVWSQRAVKRSLCARGALFSPVLQSILTFSSDSPLSVLYRFLFLLYYFQFLRSLTLVSPFPLFLLSVHPFVPLLCSFISSFLQMRSATSDPKNGPGFRQKHRTKRTRYKKYHVKTTRETVTETRAERLASAGI